MQSTAKHYQGINIDWLFIQLRFLVEGVNTISTSLFVADLTCFGEL